MNLPPRAQTIVDELIQLLGLQALKPIGFDIDIDGDNGMVQRIEPRLRFKVKKSVDERKKPS